MLKNERGAKSKKNLGTPQERVEILQQQVLNAKAAGAPVKWWRTVNNAGEWFVVVAIKAHICPQCKFWEIEEQCSNPACPSNLVQDGTGLVGTEA